jgi:hypothetical protein
MLGNGTVTPTPKIKSEGGWLINPNLSSSQHQRKPRRLQGFLPPNLLFFCLFCCVFPILLTQLMLAAYLRRVMATFDDVEEFQEGEALEKVLSFFFSFSFLL